MRRLDVQQTSFEGWTVYECTPRSHPASHPKATLFLHGGGRVREFTGFQHWKAPAKLAETTERTVVAPIYPLALEHNYRDVFPTLVRLYAQLTPRCAAEKLTLCGDSAGGGMALCLAPPGAS